VLASAVTDVGTLWYVGAGFSRPKVGRLKAAPTHAWIVTDPAKKLQISIIAN
jgi:hypothetical protein